MENDQVSPDIGAAVENAVDGLLVGQEPEPAPGRDVEAEPAPEPEKTAEPETEKAAETPKERITWQGQEIEMPLDEIKSLAQQGYDYTKKMQELKASVAPLEGLKKRIDDDPAFAAHIASYFGTAPKETKAPQFDDPIDQLKYETRQEVLKEVEEKFFKPVQEHQRQLTHQQQLQVVRQQVQADPQYAEVQKAMQDYVASLPPRVQRTTYLQLDQDPGSYLEAFQHFKGTLAKKEQPKAETPKTTAKAERAPILEAAGTVQPDTSTAERRQRIERMKTKALRNGDPLAIAEWLQASGHINNIL